MKVRNEMFYDILGYFDESTLGISASIFIIIFGLFEKERYRLQKIKINMLPMKIILIMATIGLILFIINCLIKSKVLLTIAFIPLAISLMLYRMFYMYRRRR